MAFGANYFGKAYFGQGPAPTVVYIVKSVSATSTTVATLTAKIIKTKSVSASVTTVATLARRQGRTFTATVVTVGFFTSLIVKALNLRRSSTRILTLATVTRSLDGAKETECLDYPTFTKDTQP